MNIDWSKKPDWADVWIEDRNTPKCSGWHKDDGRKFIDVNNMHYLKSSMDENETVYYPPKETKPELPLIGSEYELKPYWHKVLIVAHDVREEGTRIVYWDHHDSIYSYTYWHDLFRPIKSDKEKWIDKAITVLSNDYTRVTDIVKNRGYFEGPAVAIYEALASGELPLPKGIKNEPK